MLIVEMLRNLAVAHERLQGQYDPSINCAEECYFPSKSIGHKIGIGEGTALFNIVIFMLHEMKIEEEA